jgi:hypothetical protein
MSAILRYSLRKGNKFVEFPHNNSGLEQAKQYKKDHPEFRYARIVSILQCLPSQIEVGKEYTFSKYP